MSALLSTSSYGQKDFGAWVGVSAKVPITKNLTTGLGIQTRFESNLTEVSSSFISPYIKYEVYKYLDLSLDYRFSNNGGDDHFFGNSNTHRFALDANMNLLSNEKNGRGPKSKYKLTGRMRYTHEMSDGDLNDDYLRYRLKYAYTFAQFKLTAFVSTEFFYHFNDQMVYTFESVQSSSRFNKYRMRLGAEYPISKKHTLKAFYMVQPYIESTRTNFILGLGYQYKFSQLYKSKRK